MDRGLFTSEELDIPYHEYVRLSERKELSLGVTQKDAQDILLSRYYAPKRDSSRFAMLLFNWIAVGIFLYSIYASFVYHWWAFIAGAIAMSIIYRATKKANQENVLAAALADEDFYTRVAQNGRWLYRLSPDSADRYRRSPVSLDDKEQRKRKLKIALEYGTSLENSPPGDVRDIALLPYPKQEILDALLFSIANASNEQITDLFGAAAITLSEYQEGVGDRPISVIGVHIEELIGLPPKEAAKRIVNSPDLVRYKALEPLVRDERSMILAKVNEAKALHRNSKQNHVMTEGGVSR